MKIKYRGVTMEVSTESKIPAGAEILSGAPIRATKEEVRVKEVIPPIKPVPASLEEPPKTSKPVPSKADERVKITEDELLAMTKKKLVLLAETLGLTLDLGLKKADMVEAILNHGA